MNQQLAEQASVRPSPTLVERAAALLDRGPSRRNFLVRAAVVGSALTVSPLRFLLRPGTAYAAVCGVDSSCSSGYTAFCCTINNGINRCPPGSLVGGWWKSDNSGFCCGNARYYIDCHSYCSCGCEAGRNFCGEGCRNCSCGCGPSGQCDQRKVCCNNFRYGQCNQGISCTGPVWCRVITCTPPWRIPAWSCSTTSATDQRTNDHGAPCVEDCTPIGVKYTALGGPGSFLGEATTRELPTPDGGGRYTHYNDSSIYWSAPTGAHVVRGYIRRRWEALGWQAGPLGYPLIDETATPDGAGRYNHFTGGSIYWHPSSGTFSVWGGIRLAWERLGWEAGPLGYPLTDELTTPDKLGRYNHFTRGSIYSHPSSGAFGVWGDIRLAWERLGWEAGPLGYPLTDELTTPDKLGRYNHFTRGSIYWHPSSGAYGVWGDIRKKWEQWGREAGPLGYPVSDQRPAADGKGAVSRFVRGSIHSHPDTGVHAVWGGIGEKWVALGEATGPLGYPVTDETATPDRVGRFNHFTGGSIYWRPATGAHDVRGAIRARWEQLRWESGPLGYPVTDQRTVSGGVGAYNDFVGAGTAAAPAASIYASSATGAHSVSGPIRVAWLQKGGATGSLGFPTAEPYRTAEGLLRGDFQGGWITHDPASGAVVVVEG